MSNRRHLGRHRRKPDPIDAYADALLATGMPEREVARACFYAQHYGLEALNRGGDCLVFAEPTCANWNCLNPEHQVLTEVP